MLFPTPAKTSLLSRPSHNLPHFLSLAFRTALTSRSNRCLPQRLPLNRHTPPLWSFPAPSQAPLPPMEPLEECLCWTDGLNPAVIQVEVTFVTFTFRNVGFCFGLLRHYKKKKFEVWAFDWRPKWKKMSWQFCLDKWCWRYMQGWIFWSSYAVV